MNENGNGKNKREWVKTAAIIFLSVLLVLTFFSNTIMNYSLPEVATQYVQSGTITAKIRGTGTVESGDPYEVKVTETRKVTSVAVRVGDEVQQGDVLFYLEDAESEELKAAKDELEAAEEVLEDAQDAVRDARDAYYDTLLTGEITAEDIQAANGGVSASTYRQQISDAQAKIVPLQAKVDEIQRNIDNVDAQLALETGLDSSAETSLTAAESALQTAAANRDSALAAFNSAKNYQNSVSNGDADVKAEAEKRVKQAQDNYNNAANAYNKALETYNKANTTDANRKGSQSEANLSSQKAQYELQLYSAQKELDAAQKELDDLAAMMGNKMSIEAAKDAITDAQETVEDAQKGVDKAQAKVDEIAAKSVGGTITADIAGTVTAINVTAGNTTSAAEPVAVLQREGQGYTMSFSVTNDQARKLAVGDRADLVNAWRYDDVEVVLSSIRPDQDNPGQQKLLTFDVSGSVVAGQTLNVSVGQKSADYDLIVPNSAIREDSNGKFILIVETRSSPLGNRYVASRVDVEVLASDDTQSAISAALYGYEYVITTSTQPVEAGQLVRLANN